MHKVSNLITGLLALGVCAFMTWITMNAGWTTIIFNLAVLGVMLFIMLLSWFFGFHRMNRTVKGLDIASRKLISVYKNKTDLVEITRAGSQIFEVDYLDRKYQEYLAYLRKTNSPSDIGDYIGEYEINNYVHRRLVEMVPDILTSLGILGTFMGLVWGLRGFNPVSYEAMASSITSLIDGIKVAFVTSIYGLSLSLAYAYWLRGALTRVSESLDNFLDKYYLVAVNPTDATAMNHVLSNQKDQLRAIEGLSDNMGAQVAAGISSRLDPMMGQINQTLGEFTQVMTMSQQELLTNVAEQMMMAMKKEFIAEFAELKSLLQDTNQAEKDYLAFISQAQQQFEKNLVSGSQEMEAILGDTGRQQEAATAQMQQQQQMMSEFMDYVSGAIDSMVQIHEKSAQVLESMTQQVDSLTQITGQSALSAAEANRAVTQAREAASRIITQMGNTGTGGAGAGEIVERLDELIGLLQDQQGAGHNKRSIFR